MTQIEVCPGTKSGATTTTATVDELHDTPKCRRCRRKIWAHRSVSRSAGPTCWRHITAAVAA